MSTNASPRPPSQRSAEVTDKALVASAILGPLAAIGASFAFVTNDALMKLQSGSFSLHELVFFRTLIGLIFITAIVMPFDGGIASLRTKRWRLHLLRGLCVVFANMTFFAGLSVLPIATSTAIFFVSPLIITCFSFFFLGERIGPHRWAAVACGLIGVLIIFDLSGQRLQWALLLPLAASFGYAGLHTLTRAIGTTDKTAAMTFYVSLAFLAISLGMGLVFGSGWLDPGGDGALSFLLRAWRLPQGGEWLFILALGATSSIGGLLITLAYRKSDASLIAPVEYISMPISIVWGVVLFATWPEPRVWWGSVLIIAGGLYSLWREHRRNRVPVERLGPRR